jgi:hypothetical protein
MIMVLTLNRIRGAEAVVRDECRTGGRATISMWPDSLTQATFSKEKKHARSKA